MTDRELLELAAKAAGYTLKWGDVYIVGDDKVDCTDIPYVVSGQPDEADWHWNPLTDDGDALRLAVKLRLLIDGGYCCATNTETIVADWWGGGDDLHAGVSHDECDPYAATRRAITRAAAEIGRAMP